MKKLLTMTVGLMAALPVFAATPTDINYCSKGATAFGTTYSTYTVRCSDGAKREITAWDNRKTWCVGSSKKDCTNDQLKAAKKACQK
jgi:hypothetical protein